MASRTLQRFLADDEATARLGDDIARALRQGDVVALEGELGAGKTALARAILRALAGDRQLEVPSPTFTIVQRYDTAPPACHFDLYRIAGASELDELGLDEAVAEGIALVEWPERAGDALRATISVELSEEGAGRLATIEADGDAGQRLAHSFAIRDFLSGSGRATASRTFLLGDASIRAYETIETGGERLILMDAPARHDEPLVRDGLPYSRIARLGQSVRDFAAVAEALRERGFSAPAIEAHDYDRGLLLTEHLGSTSFLDESGRPVASRYAAAGALLAALHGHDWPRDLPVPGGGIHRLPTCDHTALGIEAELPLDWYVPHMTGKPASGAARARYMDIWAGLFARLDVAERSIVLRDFHSPNIIWRDEHRGLDRLGLIDVQDAVFGPAAYDVASLALDARVDIGEALEATVVDAYCAARAEAGAFDRAAFEQAYAIVAAQRNSKLLGTFVRLYRRDGKPGYLKHLPRIRAYLRRALRHEALAELAAFYADEGLLEEADQ